MCNCHSYNKATGSTPEVILKKPLGLFGETERPEVCIDACISEVIQHLWDHCVVTLNCCCGHNKRKPSIILKDGASEQYARDVRSVIKRIDDREFTLLTWSLVEV